MWFTLGYGIINEIYFPHVDTPNTRGLQFLILDGEIFCHEKSATSSTKPGIGISSVSSVGKAVQRGQSA